MKPYPKYRDSGVEWIGEVPEGWGVEKIKWVALINPSKIVATNRFSFDDEITFLAMENVGEKGELNTRNRKKISDVLNGFTYFEKSDVIVAKITPCFENGKGASLRNLPTDVGFGSTEFHVLRPVKIDQQFLFYVTKSNTFMKLGEVYMTGAAGQRRVPNAFIENFALALPEDIVEQSIIATYLDRKTAQIDDLIAKKHRLIALLTEERAAVINQAVTKGLDPSVKMKDSGVEWIGEIPQHWSTAPLYARYSVQLGKMLDSKRIVGTSLAPYLRNVDVQWGQVNTENLPEMDFSEEDRKRFALLPGDLLVCEGGEVGRTAIWAGQLNECYYQKAVHRLRPCSNRDHQPFFLFTMYAAAAAGLFRASGNSNTIDHLTAEKLRAHRFPFPPMEEQKTIAKFLGQGVDKLDALTAKTQESIVTLNEFRTTLISEVVTGKVDVREGGYE